jgi:hypothetical protein
VSAEADAPHRRGLATAAMQAMCAMQFAAGDAWPSFAAWAEQATPGVTFDEGDRAAMAEGAVVMGRLAGVLDG